MTLAKYDFSILGQGAPDSKLIATFRKFITHFQIDSKEGGVVKLRLYRSQMLALEQIALGLKAGIKTFTILKGRQLGISTLFLAIDIFWLIVFPGTQGAIVLDDESTRDQFKATITRYLQNLPRAFKVDIRQHNRNQLVLANGSVLYYLIAGTRKKGSFGQGKGLNFVHATELSRYGDKKAWASFRSALAERSPQRLFLFESTARGFNLFADIWEEAIEAIDNKAIFLGWWTYEHYRIERRSPVFDQMMASPITTEEQEKIDKVKELYGVTIDDEQLAWYRKKSRDLLSGEEGYVEQEFPWYADEAFRHSGKIFFPARQITALHKRAHKLPFAGFRYHMADTFDTIEIQQVKSLTETELRVWELPSRFGQYSLGADPAYGTSVEGQSENTWRDRFAICVLRCYADCVVQVAEYAADDIEPVKFAWIIAQLAGWYRNTKLVLELNGPGASVWTELKHVRRELQSGHRAEASKAAGLSRTLDQMSYYLYQRQDSFSANCMLHFKATSELKGHLMRRAKDSIILNTADIRSVPLLKEMGVVVDKDGQIGAEGRGKDDRTLAYALAYRGYDDWYRASMSAGNQTFELISAREKAAESANKTANFQSYIYQQTMALQAAARKAQPDSAGVWQFPIKEKTVIM